jgi:F-box-like
MPPTPTSLPTEMELEILDHLDAQTLKNLHCVNRRFRRLVTREQVMAASLKEEELEMRRYFDYEQTGLPCCRSLEKLPLKRFRTVRAGLVWKHSIGGTFLEFACCEGLYACGSLSWGTHDGVTLDHVEEFYSW